ncbi:unnamed protein product [Dibothriocephalus latus]|uniref:Neurotransmitter-gated ion-channel ligand-binding domain-containing protein n=1 Tax=Dibothriocephalus latus TaxID=60516 RepID=A0A3P6PJU5_DIBLA|nr:unnamed protein product [Dibothriocephalus latus]
MESEQSIVQGDLFIRDTEEQPPGYISFPDPGMEMNCSVPIAVVSVQPPSTESNEPLTETSLADETAKHSSTSAYSDFRAHAKEEWEDDQSKDVLHCRGHWESLPFLECFDDLTSGLRKNFSTPSRQFGPARTSNERYCEAKASSSFLQPSIPRPLISRRRHVSQSEASVALMSLHIDFEVGSNITNNRLRISNPQGMRQVYLCVIFLKIGEIDTIKEQYAADVLIKAKWRDANMDAVGSTVSKSTTYITLNNREASEYDWLHNWTPKLYIENTIGETREQLHQMIALNEFGHAFLVEKRRVSGVFLENLELNHFPFDVQDLTITVASNLPSSEIRLLNDPDEPHRINKQSFVGRLAES